MFGYWQMVRVASRFDGAPPFLGWIASRPIGLKGVPAMGVFYFVLAPRWRGYVSAERLSAVPAPADAPSTGDLQ